MDEGRSPLNRLELDFLAVLLVTQLVTQLVTLHTSATTKDSSDPGLVSDLEYSDAKDSYLDLKTLYVLHCFMHDFVCATRLSHFIPFQPVCTRGRANSYHLSSIF